MLTNHKKWIVFVTLLLIALAFRISVAHWLPNDAPDDGRMYAQIARNVLEQHVYSHETEAPYDPTLIRLPGYPLFLASIYSIFGHTNNGAVRIVQALIDTATCVLVALLAFYWQPDEMKKRKTAIAALALAAVCPFTTIYAATILTEVTTTFLVMAMLLAVTFAFQNGCTREGIEKISEAKKGFNRAIVWWLVAGLCGGLAVLFRPDSGLFAFAVGLTLVISALVWGARAERSGDGALDSAVEDKSKKIQSGVALRWLPHSKDLAQILVTGSAFSLAFVLVLAPWTIRNARTFHLFQPLAPSHGEMPGEFVPRGYQAWLRTWLDDEAYIAPFLWSLDSEPITIDDVPASAFDSADEKARVAALLDKYNHPEGAPTANPAPPQTGPSPSPQTSPTPPGSGKNAAPGKATPTPTSTPQNTNANINANANADSGDEGDQDDNSTDENDNSSDQADESDNADEPDKTSAEHGPVEMTPEIDAGFAEIARERIARHRFSYYVWLPLKRAHTMWFDTHSQYWPFEGTLLPLEDLDHTTHQHIWLPLFAILTGLYTLLGLAGAWVLWDSRTFAARRWLLLVALSVVLRLALFSSMENPEPRYLVEFFPFLAVLGGIAIARVPRLRRTTGNEVSTGSGSDRVITEAKSSAK
jgi:hypothetical protein